MRRWLPEGINGHAEGAAAPPEDRKTRFTPAARQEYESEILAYQKQNLDKFENAQKQYQANLKVALAKVAASREKDNKAFEITYDIMTDKTDEINAFNIKMTTKRALSDLTGEQQYQIYRAQVRGYKRESILVKLLDKIDEMRFEADKHLDDNFELYHTSTYF